MKTKIIVTAIALTAGIILFHQRFMQPRTIQKDDKTHWLSEMRIAETYFVKNLESERNDVLIQVYYEPGGESAISRKLLKISIRGSDTTAIVMRKYYSTKRHAQSGLFEDHGCKLVIDTLCPNMGLNKWIAILLKARLDTVKSLDLDPSGACFDCPGFLVKYADCETVNAFHWDDIPEIEAKGAYADIKALMLGRI